MATAAEGNLVGLFSPVGADKAPFVGRITHVGGGNSIVSGFTNDTKDGEAGAPATVTVPDADLSASWWDVEDPLAHPTVPKPGDVVSIAFSGFIGALYALVLKAATIIVPGEGTASSPFTGENGGESDLTQSVLYVQVLEVCNGVPTFNNNGLRMSVLFPPADPGRVLITAAGVGVSYTTSLQTGGGG